MLSISKLTNYVLHFPSSNYPITKVSMGALFITNEGFKIGGIVLHINSYHNYYLYANSEG